jgi:hypothetical protein
VGLRRGSVHGGDGRREEGLARWRRRREPAARAGRPAGSEFS